MNTNYLLNKYAMTEAGTWGYVTQVDELRVKLAYGDSSTEWMMAYDLVCTA